MRKPFLDRQFTLGICGGGQLGKMLCQQTSQWALRTAVLDKSLSFPAGDLCADFVEGDFTDHDAVLEFGRDKDVVTIEIESVNGAALKALREEGIPVHPDPAALEIIKDKAAQKSFYLSKGLPTSRFETFENKAEIIRALEDGVLDLPFVVKARKEGYDGRGVMIIHSREELEACFDTTSIVEPALAIQTELSVIAVRGEDGTIRTFPPVSMAFHPTANLVEYLYCPAGLPPEVEKEATDIARMVIGAFDLCGLLAVEMFLTTDGTLLINEVAPRPHNSGHHTIEACNHSQFEQHLRAIIGLPLPEIVLNRPAVMMNILGHPEHSGPVRYRGIPEALEVPGVHVHIYGKSETKPHRKMGHITVTGDRLEQVIERAKFARNLITATI